MQATKTVVESVLDGKRLRVQSNRRNTISEESLAREDLNSRLGRIDRMESFKSIRMIS